VAKQKITRMNKNQLQSNVEVVKAVQELNNYTPINPDYALPKLEACLDEMNSLRAVEDAAEKALKAARDKTIMAEWKLHKIAMGAKDQIIAQYGKDSDEYRSLGLKKKSDYKKRGPSNKTEISQA
jgi:hypothetical protein